MTVPYPETIPDLLSANRDRNAAKPAIFGESSDAATHAALLEHAEYVRRCLAAWGFGPEDRIAIVLPAGSENALCLLGIMCGAVAAPLNPNFKAGEFAFYFSDLDARAVIVPSDGFEAARTAAADANIPAIVFRPEKEGAPLAFALDLEKQPRREGAPQDTPKPSDLALLLHTSGTTARPKLVTITHGSLLAKSANTIAALRLGADDRCCNIMPLFHGHGIYDGLVAPLLAGGSTIQLALTDVGRFFETIEPMAPTWLTAGFGLHRMILENSAPFAARAQALRLRLLRSGSGALDGDTADRLRSLYGAQVVLTYATTETGTVAAARVDGVKSPAGLVPFPARRNFAVLTDDGLAAASGEVGEIAVKGPHVSAYAGIGAADHDGWLRTGDLGHFDDQERLHIVGRRKEIINRGGEKISPAEIDAVLNGHPDVKAGAAFAVPHKTLGQEVAAAVVPRAGTDLDTVELKAFVGKNLASFKVPRRIFVTDSLPVTSTGKVRRADLAKLFGVDPAKTKNRDWQQGDVGRVEKTLAKIWANELGVKRVGLDEDFFLLGGDSLQAVRVFEEIERAFNRKMPSSVLFEAGTVREMARMIVEAGLIEPIFPLRSEGTKTPLFIAPGGGGNIISFRHLAKYIEPDRPVYAMQPMGLWRDADTIFSIEKMAELYIGKILEISPEGPFLLAGYSFGGLVAHEMAAQLQARGFGVRLLILIDCYLKKTVFEFGPRAFAERHAPSLAKIYRNPRQLFEFARARIGNIGAYGGRWLSVQNLKRAKKAARTRGEKLPLSLRSVRNAQLIARQHFDPKIYDGPAILLAAENDELRPPRAFDRWPEVLSRPFKIETTPGNHATILREPNAPHLAKLINAHLAETTGA